MKITVTKLTGRDVVKRAMLTTQGKHAITPDMSDETLTVQLLGLHSTLEVYIWEVLIEGCPEREHTHIVRHEEIGKFVSTSRPDWSDESTHGSRMIRLFIPTNRLVEICEDRLCGAAWKGTRAIFSQIKKKVSEIDPLVSWFLTPPCSKRGYCTEVRSYCGYLTTQKCTDERKFIIDVSAELVKKFSK